MYSTAELLAWAGNAIQTGGFHCHLMWGTEETKMTWVYPSRNWGCTWALEEASKVITICVLCCLCMANVGISLSFCCACSNPWTAIYRNYWDTACTERGRWLARHLMAAWYTSDQYKSNWSNTEVHYFDASTKCGIPVMLCCLRILPYSNSM